MPVNVEYPTVPLNKNVKIWQHFWAENITKVPIKGKGTWLIIWLHANYLFYVKIHMNVNKNCDIKVECGKAHFTSK